MSQGQFGMTKAMLRGMTDDQIWGTCMLLWRESYRRAKAKAKAIRINTPNPQAQPQPQARRAPR